MLDRIFHQTIHKYVYWIGLLGIVVGLPFGIIILSVAYLLLSANFLLEGDFKTKINRLKTNKLAILLFTFFILHLFGMLWSSDMDYGWHDIKAKLPLLILPIIILGSEKLPKKTHSILLFLFVLSVLLASLVNWSVFYFQNGVAEKDLRSLSLFGSHIRFALLISLSIGICLYFITYGKRFKWLALIFISWLIYYALFSEVLSGYLGLAGILILFFFWLAFKQQNKWIKYGFSSLLGFSLITGTLLLYFVLHIPQQKQYKLADLPAKTILGNDYTHDVENQISENGNLVYLYLCHKELKEQWEKHSKISYDGFDAKGQPIYGTLVRYMTSKGLHKDSVGFSKLSTIDIQNVENGIASIIYTKAGFSSRLNEIRWEWNSVKNPNEHSLLQRIEYWKTGIEIIKQHPFIGVGTGDVAIAFQKQYETDHSILVEKNRHRAHQQFLTCWIAFGIFGLVLFLIIHVEFSRNQFKSNNLIGIFFGLILVLSYLSEDTIETQVGVTFFSFFLAFFYQGKEETVEKI